MTNTYRELVLGGVLVAPPVAYAALTFALVLVLRPLLHRVGFARLFSHPSLAELSVYASLFGVLTLIL